MKPATLLPSCLLTAACVLAMPGNAIALPPDPPVSPVAPPDGATVPSNAEGIPVSYQCPPYTSDVFIGGDSSDYQVRFSDSPALGPDGLLATQPYGSDRSGPEGADGTCTATLDTYDGAGSPEIVGGRVHWQVFRSCLGCTPQWETATPRSFVVRPSITGTLKAPRGVYAGYLSVFALESDAPLSGAQVRLQRRAGKRWTTVAKESYELERTALVAKLPAGRQTLRVVVAAGASSFAVATKKLTVRRPGRRLTSGRDDGRYEAHKPAPNSTLTFRVTQGGRTLRGFRASLTAFCIGPRLEDNRTVIAFAVLGSARVGPGGSVTGLLKSKKGASVLLTGRLRRGRFKGEVEMSFSACTGSRMLDARRKG